MKKKLGLSMRGRHILEGYSFISLWIAGFFLFMAVPLGRSFYFSINNMESSKNGLQATYVGMLNYRSAFSTDIDFLPLLKSTMTTMLTQVPLILIFAMFSALLLNGKIKGRTIFRGIFFLPVIIASGAVLKELMQQGAAQLPIFTQDDLFNKLGGFIPENILEPLLKYADSLTLVMWDSGVQILIFIAGLQTISPQLYEAAKMDGATKWESFWKVTFPMIIPMLFVNTLYSIVNMFTKADNKVMDYINQQAFQKNNYGYGAALGWIYFVLIAIVLAIVFIIFRRSLAASEGRG
ncbi:carbohydrate ABC transporter membrane protein 1 (CUT1 family) [Paenibacillus cellulosilyticus]|uniref:Carbohydrate ABC transporter membrane protein 1 (CUT1 family) n=1 Tax=Paenibacillus cellulosilyticus TaxID=375489 RepID=A0A2V2YK19_9BACL|nr:sugar ABC transporter permease [Paenibacillus cellulosilyticus]PWV92098.1 carbohydrate ABC transporter membrane protein 1 (CUT1 family) [Paenibacillus cellulosilyticus]QKS44208.1 sugar ABC transporter permease [Paenibacillus cellulosilyticus]